MKICVVGAGAIGGLLAAKLAHAGEQVTVIARGPHLAAIRAHGLKLIEENGERARSPRWRPPTRSPRPALRISSSSA